MDNTILYEKGNFTLEDFKRIIKDRLEERSKPREFTVSMPCDDYTHLNDAEFRAFVTCDGLEFMGGKDGHNRMSERMVRLGIK